MSSTYLLKNLSHKGLIACLGDDRPADLDAASMEAYITLLRVAGAILAAGDVQLQRHKISQARMRLLAQLRISGEDGLPPWELADHLGVARATITRLLDGLEHDGLVERRPSKSDRRSLLVHLSARGRALLRRVLPQRVERIQTLTAGLSTADKRTLVTLLERIEANVPALAEPPR
jgi:DNA-binding MarR family transcriptional regulator